MQLYVKTIDMVVNFRDVDQCSGSLMEIQIHFQIRSANKLWWKIFVLKIGSELMAVDEYEYVFSSYF